MTFPTSPVPRRRPSLRRLGLELAAVVAGVLALGAWQARGLLPGGSAPEAVLPSLSGEPVSLASLRGRPVLLAFWAPWCGVCGAEAQNLGWVRRLAGERAHVVTVATAGGLDEIRAFVREHELGGTVLLGDDETVRRFAVDTFPTVYFLDAAGHVKRSVVGYTTTPGLLARLFL